MDFGGVGGGGGGGGPEQWFYNLPPVSRIWLGLTTLITALINLDILQWSDLDFVRWEDLIGRGSSGRIEAWRYVNSYKDILSMHSFFQQLYVLLILSPLCVCNGVYLGC